MDHKVTVMRMQFAGDALGACAYTDRETAREFTDRLDCDEIEARLTAAISMMRKGHGTEATAHAAHAFARLALFHKG